jgi:membrane-bound lytic murein transglycosylase B
LAFLLGTLTLAHLAFAEELSAEERARLEREYNSLQEEITQWENVLTETRAKKNTLQGDVTYLNAQIKEAEAQIRQKNLAITKLGDEIHTKTKRIGELEFRIDKGRDSLASLIRRKHEIDDLSIVEVALATESAFDLFEDVDRIASVETGLHREFALIRGVKAETESERAELSKKQDQELDARYVVETKKQQVKTAETEKQKLLTITKNEEQAYSQVLAERKQQAAAIRARLFPLRDAEGIPFGTALEYAKVAGAATGVQPAVILAFLSQESDLGRNVGQCYVTDLTTGNGKGKNTGTPFTGVMKAPRDTVPFEAITKALGYDWSTTVVSCPQPGGYGGAMGPAQFIPSTWQIIASRVTSALGISSANPWDAKHAIMANALFISDLGASAQTYTAERNAACRYFSGSACPSSGWIASYGDQVMAKAAKFQQDIDFLRDN